jgi:hypothetical protein
MTIQNYINKEAVFPLRYSAFFLENEQHIYWSKRNSNIGHTQSSNKHRNKKDRRNRVLVNKGTAHRELLRRILQNFRKTFRIVNFKNMTEKF